ncbi:hypothetical protein [Pectobacterium carotovorum]|nr:hypothetical protein [Pectobacterium carotovorum]
MSPLSAISGVRAFLQRFARFVARVTTQDLLPTVEYHHRDGRFYAL